MTRCDFRSFFQLPGCVPLRPLGALLRLLLPPALPVPRALRLPARPHRADRLGLHHARSHHRALHRHLLAAQVRKIAIRGVGVLSRVNFYLRGCVSTASKVK